MIAGDNDQPDLLFDARAGARMLVHEATCTEEMAQKICEVGHSYGQAYRSVCRIGTAAQPDPDAL
ncbi:hypothetical protein [Vreelandella populi]|uniref:hypothetical protein n=1 Tax=Vreelandella populi TaxID=2498858 RepID=UPI0021AFEBAE|nr:hypothetical protein [Halomonas populi]